MKSILVTGGTGYIGSHTTLLLLQAGFNVIVIDNLCNSSSKSLVRVAQISGRKPVFIEGDIRDTALLKNIFTQHSVGAVFHFAGLKSVNESIAKPLEYFDNNVRGTKLLLESMADNNIFNIVFSSSATVYGEISDMPLSETRPMGKPTNPYGASKVRIENLMQAIAISDSRWRIAILRYFNPIGAHESGLIGEDPKEYPNNLLPLIMRVALGNLAELKIFGNDYPTPDGTCIYM